MLEALTRLHPIDHEQLEHQLEDVRNVLKSIDHHHRALFRMAFASLRENIVLSEQERIKKKFFDLWSLEWKKAKLIKQVIPKRFIKALKMCKIHKEAIILTKVQQETADNHHQKRMKRMIFLEWKAMRQQNKKSKMIEKMRKQSCFKFLISVIEVIKANKFAKEISGSIYNGNLLRKVFGDWNIGAKVVKVEHLRRLNSFSLIYRTIARFNQEQKTKYSNYRTKKITKVCFSQLKTLWQEAKARKHYTTHILSKYFNVWLSEGAALFYEKEQQNRLESELMAHLERKRKIKLMYCFNKWSRWVEQTKEQRQKNLIAKQYGKAKEKESLLRKYFDSWKELKAFNQAYTFRVNKLKWKAWEGFSRCVFRSVDRWERVYRFVERREKRKYFQAIKAFNISENQKVLMHRKKRSFNLLGMAVVRQFMFNKHKAELYHSRCLAFKTIFSLKKAVELTAKQKRTVIYIHCNMVLQRWSKGYRVRQFAAQRKYLIMARVFHQLKLRRMNQLWTESCKKSNTQTKPRKRTNNEQQEDTFSLEKISLQSPDKLFSLDYSISNYQSNNISDYNSSSRFGK